MTAPFAPWSLSGESLVGLARCSQRLGPVPWGLRPLPGPVLVMAVCYTSSPVGPYLELAVGEPARLGMRPGWCITTMVVDSAESRMGGKLNWGFPKQLGSLVWDSDGAERELRWVERDVVVRGRVMGPPLPMLLPVRTVQRRGDGPVVVPGRLRGRARPAKVEVEAPGDDPLAPLAGRHPGLHVAGMHLLVRPARQPVGFASTLRAPLRAPEPALCWDAPGRLAQR
ncbi:MAG: acetoacetate decarboxylase family protein [Actinomycetota bacterium]|nr:acetoacetate decarboxylase family protein [Actinomycetota bacterium]MDP9019497.1 acetoacetate decarboxylase family protein [Actinomycetota bacterium]